MIILLVYPPIADRRRRERDDIFCDRSVTANLRTTNIMDFGGFDSSIIVIVRGGIPRPIGNLPESLSQAILAGIMLVGRLGAARLAVQAGTVCGTCGSHSDGQNEKLGSKRRVWRRQNEAESVARAAGASACTVSSHTRNPRTKSLWAKFLARLGHLRV